MARLQQEAIRPGELERRLRQDADGALAVFLGTVRDSNQGRKVRFLRYEAYDGMAQLEMQRIEREALERFDVSRVEIVHRTGRLEIGEVAVAIVAAAPHRAAAFEACRFLIESVKHRVPIWKKEVFEGGEVWIEGAGPGSARSRRDQA
jgi:molybdopterin synthase catalytic subunit